MLDYITIVVASCRRFSCCRSHKSRTIKVIEVISNIVVQKLIVCRTRNGDRARSSRGRCKIARTIKLDLLIGSEGNYAAFCGRVEERRSSRTNQQWLWFAFDLIKFNNFQLFSVDEQQNSPKPPLTLIVHCEKASNGKKIKIILINFQRDFTLPSKNRKKISYLFHSNTKEPQRSQF